MLFTFDIFSFVLGIAFVLFFVAIAIVIAITIDIAIVITFAIDSFVFALWAGGSVAVEDDEEREAEKPKRVVLMFFKINSCSHIFRNKETLRFSFLFLVM